MSYDSDSSAFREIRSVIDKLEAAATVRPLAKCDPLEPARRRTHSLFMMCVAKLTREGWSQHKMAKRFGCDVSTLNKAIHYGDTKAHQIQGWLLTAAMAHARFDAAREIASWSEPPPASATGTEGP